MKIIDYIIGFTCVCMISVAHHIQKGAVLHFRGWKPQPPQLLRQLGPVAELSAQRRPIVITPVGHERLPQYAQRRILLLQLLQAPADRRCLSIAHRRDDCCDRACADLRKSPLQLCGDIDRMKICPQALAPLIRKSKTIKTAHVVLMCMRGSCPHGRDMRD